MTREKHKRRHPHSYAGKKFPEGLQMAWEILLFIDALEEVAALFGEFRNSNSHPWWINK